jgi:hypothetical protein
MLFHGRGSYVEIRLTAPNNEKQGKHEQPDQTANPASKEQGKERGDRYDRE